MTALKIVLFTFLLSLIFSFAVLAEDADVDGFEDERDNCPFLENGGRADSLLEGESRSLTVDNSIYDFTITYDVTLAFVDFDEVKFRVNGEITPKLHTGESYVLSDTSQILVTGILYQDYPGGIHSANFRIGGQRDTNGDGRGNACEEAEPSNHPPYFEDMPSIPEYINEGEAYTFTINVGDEDEDVVNISWSLDDNVVSRSTSFTYIPSYDAAGSHEIDIDISDGKSSESFLFYIEVRDVSEEPVPTPRTSNEEQEYTRLEEELKDIEDDYSKFRRKYTLALDAENPDEVKKYQRKLENLEEELDNIEDDTEKLRLEIRDNSTLEHKTTLLNAVEELEENIDDLQDDLGDTLQQNEESPILGYEESSISTFGNTEKNSRLVIVSSVVFPEQGITPPESESRKTESITPIILMGGGIIVTIGIIVFLWFLL